MKKYLFTLFMILATMVAIAQNSINEVKIVSPQGKLSVKVSNTDGKVLYEVTSGVQTIVSSSPLGLMTSIGNLSQGLTLTDCKQSSIHDQYSLSTIKQSNISYDATEAICSFDRDGRHLLDIIFRVSDRDVAFRYKVYPQGQTLACEITGEATSFRLPDSTTTFLCPQSRPMGGFARTSPSYETSYTTDAPVGSNGWGEGFTFPCLFKTVISGEPLKWVLISETGTDGSYVGCRLLNEGGSHYSIGFPQQGEQNGHGTTGAAISLPGETPWRTITIGTLSDIVETTVAWDVVKPKYPASKDYTFGKGAWSWIIKMDPSCNFDEQKRYIDFAAAMGWRSVLVDALWDTQIGYPRMEQLSAYAREKGVGLYLWYNSNGTWNDAPQGPRHKMDRSTARRNEMAWMQKHGILGIKVDFFGGDKQSMMQLYEDILTDANDYGLQVIFHGCTLPRGWERMYPNYVASEAVLASENLHFSQQSCDNEALCATIHPFIRNTVGSMDFGGSALNRYYSADNQHGTHRVTSDVYALATAVLFQSSVQHFALAPNNLSDAPQWAVRFMQQVPTTWDETRFIDGYPGKYVIMARRSGNHWFVVGVNAQQSPIKQTITLPMFDKGEQLTVYSDDVKTLGSVVTTVKHNKKQQIAITIPNNGGVVITNN